MLKENTRTSANVSFGLWRTVTSNILLTLYLACSSRWSSLGLDNGTLLVLSMIRTSEPSRLCRMSSSVQFIRRIDVANKLSANTRPFRAKCVRLKRASPCSGRCIGDVCDCNNLEPPVKRLITRLSIMNSNFTNVWACRSCVSINGISRDASISYL